jgi:propanol-preferring alcohol dehydrogenase
LSGYTVDGTFQQYCIAKAAHVARLHKDIPLDAIAPVLCAGITVYKGLKESGAKPGQTVAIVGAGGGLGSLAQQYAKAMGLRTIAIDTGDDKKKMCLEQLGSHAFIDFAKSQNVVKDVQAATEDGLGPHAVILVAVNEKPFQQAAEVCTRILESVANANIQVVRSPKRHGRLHRSPSWCIPESTSLRVRHQDGNHQGLVRR